MRIDDVLPTPKLYKLDGTLQLHIAKEGNNPQISEAFLKPSMPGIFWTSTAKQNKDGNYSSEWSNWCKVEMPEWFNNRGLLFQVMPGARVLQMNNDDEAIEISKYFNHGEPKSRWWQNSDVDWARKFPWKRIAEKFDGLHHIPGNRVTNIYTGAYDVESTVWFNRSHLKLLGTVNVT